MKFKELPLENDEHNCPRCPGILQPIAFVKYYECHLCGRRFKKGAE